MASTDFVDPYLDPTTGLLRNKVGATTQVALDQAEGDLVLPRLVELYEAPVAAPTGTLDELREIHRHPFQGVYDWAGEVRTVDIRKPGPDAQPFLAVSRIEGAAQYVHDELKADRFLSGLEREPFVERLAHHYDQLNYLHPFREGNGRAQRVFLTQLAEHAGWQLDWRGVSGTENDVACRAGAEDFDLAPLRSLLDRVVVGRTEDLEARSGAQRARAAFGHRSPQASSGNRSDRIPRRIRAASPEIER